VGHVRHEGGDLAIAKAVRADPRLAAIPLVLAPVSGVRGHARDVREAGYSAYIPRPFQGAELLQCLQAAAMRGQEGPIDDPRLITRHNVADQSNLPAGGRVLVADDDPASRQVTCLQIARLGYLVDEVTGGRDAVTAAAGGAYQLILMDAQMPDMDGPAAAAAIRSQESPGRQAFIVALTADVSIEQRKRCREAGMDEFLEKPLRTQTLAGLLNRHLRRGHESVATGPDKSHTDGDTTAVTAIECLEADIGEEMTLDLVREYLAGVERAIERLSRREHVDGVSVRSVAHRLLGGARVLGLARFECIWAPLADGRDEADPRVSPAVIDDLREACADLTVWIDSHQRKQNA
jgi:CheY-like chemotaxis protein